MVRKSRLASTMNLLRARLAADERGATAIEYAMIASGIGAALAATVYNLGSALNGLFTNLLTLFH